jgi:hypothetical protein
MMAGEKREKGDKDNGFPYPEKRVSAAAMPDEEIFHSPHSGRSKNVSRRILIRHLSA